MCGINGFYDFNKKYDKEECRNLIHRMNEKILYRGPDHEGIYQYQNLTMGMRRLSILDLDSGNQPIYNEFKDLAIVFNGEIYNFRSLRQKLEKSGHRFYTNTDTEVIIHAYEEYGCGFLEQLDGMFAISIYNTKTKELLIARDRMGEKPLYYYKDNDYFLFGSELKSLISTNIIKKQISRRALNQYLQLTYIPAPLTIYENVFKLLPGHYLTITADGNIKDTVYWNLKNISLNNSITYREAQDNLSKLVTKSIKNCMVSDVPVGSFLSGGIDSGTIVGIMSKLSERPIDTFTIGFHEKQYDERLNAKKTSDLNKTNHHEYVLEYKEVLNSINTILKNMDEPFADPSILPTYFISKFARNYVKVVLTGDAGDELFLGYSKYLINYYSKIYHFFPKWMRYIFKSIVMNLPDKSSTTRKLRKVLKNADKNIFDQHKSLMCLGFKEPELKKLLKKSLWDSESLQFISQKYNELKDFPDYAKMQYTDLAIVLEGDMLAKVDRMSMINSLETRTPLLSKEIVEFAFSLPYKFKIKGTNKKRIMKSTFKTLLPEKLEKKRKTGFDIPLDCWFRNELKSLIEELLNKDEIIHQGIFNENYITQILEEHNTGKVNRMYEIWTLIVFQKWYMEEFL